MGKLREYCSVMGGEISEKVINSADNSGQRDGLEDIS